MAGFALLGGLLLVPVGTMGSLWPGISPFGALGAFHCGFFLASDWPFRGCGGLMGCAKLPRFILLVSLVTLYLWFRF